jgi:hypothetical protein
MGHSSYFLVVRIDDDGIRDRIDKGAMSAPQTDGAGLDEIV